VEGAVVGVQQPVFGDASNAQALVQASRSAVM